MAILSSPKTILRAFTAMPGYVFETNPVPVKTSLALMGKIEENIRLPLAKMQETNLNKLKEVLRAYKLI